MRFNKGHIYVNPNAASSDKVFFNNQEVMTSSLGTDLLLMESIGKEEKNTFCFHKIYFAILRIGKFIAFE